VDLFTHGAARDRRGQPLAERMRPRRIEEFVGQRHLLGEGRLLDRLLNARELPSIILWGPPGTGKTTLARILAEARGARFESMSAVLVGVSQIREVVAEAARLLAERSERTVLFLDEIHRFHKGQQDALLPHVEAGTVILIGATTENPSFEINSALMSRTTVVRLESLDETDLRALVDRALGDRERGLGGAPIEVAPEVRDRLAREADGDARRVLGVLEIAASIARSRAAGGAPIIDDGVVDEAAGRRAPRYDKAGEEHYNVVSAFIKSMRGSDVDAAVYWMVRMLEAGEDPLFVARRMVIFAAEDVGMADPRALGVATAAADAVRFIGLPEAVLPMTEAAIYLASAEKSNSALTTYAKARRAVLDGGTLPVPLRFRNAPTALMKEMGFGRGYRYPHDFDGHYVAEDYLPDELGGARFYEPGGAGYERQILERQAARRARKTDQTED
jgi:putative ATPase